MQTFTFTGGVESLVMLQVNPDLIKNRVHRAATREVIQKGLGEVQLNENPDLVVRYWTNTETQLSASANADWDPFGPFVDSYWGFWFNNVTVLRTRDGSLQIDLIDPPKKSLAWRLYIMDKISNADEVWKQADEQIVKGFQRFPPSPKEVEAKQKEREEHKPKS